MTDDIDHKRAQVAAQCRAVARLATEMAQIHADYQAMMEKAIIDSLIDQVGDRTAYFMERLGDMLAGMDAALDEDDWLTPIFAEAQRLWPQDSAA